MSRRGVLLAVFFVSGFVGLVYETLWQKQMILLLGASAPAIVAILAAFFAGIALGGRLGDALLVRYRLPELRLYAFAELTIAVNGLAMPLIQELLHAAYLSVAHACGATSATAYSFRFLATMAAVLPATVAMGATIPFMAGALKRYASDAVARIYGINALGAMVGSLVGPLCLVPAFGIRNSLLVAFVLNLIVVLVAFQLSWNEAPAEIQPPAAATANGFSWRFAYLVAGAVALGAETTWLRMLSMVIVNGPLLFAMTLAVFLGAYAIGSLLVHPLLSRKIGPQAESAWVQLAVAGSLLATVPVFRFLPNLHSLLLSAASPGQFPRAVQLYEVVAVVAIVFLPAVAMGVVFPALARVTSATGTLYFWGNLGSLAGVILFGLVVIPHAGLNGSLMILVSLSALVGLWLLPRSTRVRVAAAATCASSLALWVTLPPFAQTDGSVRRLPGGIYGEFKNGSLRHKILRYHEGPTSTVTIRESLGLDGTLLRRVFVDEQRVAATDPDAVVDSKMLAHLPAMLHPNPQRALSVGYGSGGTSWSLTTHNLQARTVEIEGEILKSAQLFPYASVWNNPNFKAIHNDARDHLQTTDERYDFISTDVTNLQYNQNSSLYTVEYFKMMQDRLTDDGIACAWIPMSSISPESFRTLLATFQHVYPHATLWLMNEMPTYFGILIGTREPLHIDLKRMAAAMANPAVKADLASIEIEHPYQVAASLLLDEDGMRGFTQGAPLHTDDDPVLEHSASYHNYLYYNHFVSNLTGALKYRPLTAQKLVAGLSPAERADFDRVWISSKHWYEAIAAMSELRVTPDPAAQRALANDMRFFASEAVRAYPGWQSWQDLYTQMMYGGTKPRRS